MMYTYLRRLFVLERRLSEAGLERAVEFTWLTRQQATTLKAERTKLMNAEESEVEAEEETPPATEE